MKELELRISDLQDVMEQTSDFCKEVCKLCSGNSYPCKERLLIAVMDKDATIAGLKKSYAKVKQDFEALKRKRGTPKKKTVNVGEPVKVNGYYKLQRYSIGQILPLIGGHKKLQVTPEIAVNVHSVRLRSFKQSIVCAHCGIIGTHFWAESNNDCGGYHLNMYALNEHGHEVLMTRDHIIPRSRGGSEGLENMQTMCTRCNSKKGNKLEEELCQR